MSRLVYITTRNILTVNMDFGTRSQKWSIELTTPTKSNPLGYCLRANNRTYIP